MVSASHHAVGSAVARHVEHVRPDMWVLDSLERCCGEYFLLESTSESVFGALHEPFHELVQADDIESFDAELSRVVHLEGRELLRRFGRSLRKSKYRGPRNRDLPVDLWPLVERALGRVLGEDGSDRFRAGLALLTWRGLLARQLGEPPATRELPEGRTPVMIPDPDLARLESDTTAADLCLVAAVCTIGLRRSVSHGVGLWLAEYFCRGQRAAVQILASILALDIGATPLVDSASEFAGIALLDLESRFLRAQAADCAIRSAIDRAPQRSVISLFPSEDEPAQEDYRDDDPSEWVRVES